MLSNITIHHEESEKVFVEASESLINSLKTHQNEKVLLLLSGGSAVKLYESIKYYVSGIKYKNLAFAQIDERFQPGKSVNSQQSTVNKEEMNAYQIEKVGLWEACKEKNIPYYIISQEGTLEEAAEKYNQTISKLFKEYQFKIGILGIGEDCHTAGLLPGFVSLWDSDKLVVGFKNGGKYPMRISVTPKALQMLDQVVVTACGEQKREGINNILKPENISNLDKYPAAILQKVIRVDLYTDILDLPRRPASQRGEQGGLDDFSKRDKIKTMNSRYWMMTGGIVLLVIVAGALVGSQMRQMQKPQELVNSTENITSTPQSQFELKILSPSNGVVVNSQQLLVRGITKPDAELFINDKDTIADASGNFSVTLSLDEGENLIIVTANDMDGNIAEDQYTVTYEQI